MEDFDRLYRETRGRLRATLVGILGDLAAAEDCLQDAYVHAFQAWPKWRPEAPAEAWLHRIALNAARSFRRRQRLREVGELIQRLGRPPDPVDPTQSSRSELVLALRRLPRKQAAAIVLRHYHGYTNREIGLALGVPERTIASRLAAAKARLQADLSNVWREDMGSSAPLGVEPKGEVSLSPGLEGLWSRQHLGEHGPKWEEDPSKPNPNSIPGSGITSAKR